MKLRYLFHVATLVLLMLVAEPRKIWNRHTLVDPGKIVLLAKSSQILFFWGSKM